MKKSKIKAYRNKFSRMDAGDRGYVLKVLGIFTIVVIIVIVILSMIVYTNVHRLHAKHGERDNIKDAKMFSDYVGEKELLIDLADENKEAENPPDEAVLLAHLVTAEAGGTSRETQLAVASVVMNRVESDLFPNTIYDVIYQEGQYECVINGAIEKDLIESATESAYYVYQNGSQIPCNVLWQAEFVQGSGIWAFLDGEYFCYE